MIRPIRENLAFTFEFSPIIDRVIEGLRPAHTRTIQGVDYLDAIEHATICMRLPRGLFVSIGLMVVYSSSLRSQRRFEAAASELESRLGQRHQPALAYGIAANAPKFIVAFDVPAQPAANDPELTIVGTRTAS